MKKLVSMILVIAMMLSLAACASSGSTTTAAGTSGAAGTTAAEPSKTWNISVSAQVNTNDTIGSNSDKMAQGMSAATNGVVTANFFGGGTLGAQKDVFNALATGEIEMAVDGSIPVDMFAPEYGFLVAPYLIRSMDHLQNLIDSDIWAGFEKKLADNGIVILGVILRGSRQTVSTKELDWTNTSSIIIRMPNVATYITAWSAAGANTQVLGGGEVYSALQTGTVNAAEGPWSQHAAMSLIDMCKYGYETNHMHEFYAVYASKTWFDSLPAETQTALKSYIAGVCSETSKQTMAEAETMKQQLIDAGMEITTPDVTALFEAAATEWDKKFADGTWASSMEEILKYNK